MTALEDAVERVKARIRHSDECSDCNDTRILIAEVERLTAPPTDAEREALVDHALRIASKGVQINDGHTYSVHAHDLVDYAETIRALVLVIRRQGPITDAMVDAALDAWYSSGHHRAAVGMRAALEAARAER